MLTQDQIDHVRHACSGLPPRRANALGLAAAYRTLTVYQAYSEGPFKAGGHGASHDAMVYAWRTLRGRQGASISGLRRKVKSARDMAERDIEMLGGSDDFDLLEALTIESISAAVLALGAMLSGDRESIFDAMMTAIEIDLVWSESLADSAAESVPSDGVAVHYSQQVRDIQILFSAEGVGEDVLFRDLAFCAEREGMSYLVRARELVAARIADE
jgi:hypothetical protein